MKRKLTPIIDDLVREIYPLVKHDPRVTENVFHYIQNDPMYMKRYRELVDEYTKDPVNKAIGKRVKDLFDLSNTGKVAADKRRTTMIKGFTLH